MSQNTNDAPRKPSGSSSLSGTHSPLGSPGNVCPLVSEAALFSVTFLFVTQAQPQRRVAHPPANSTLGVGVGTPGALANSSLGSGWQVSGNQTTSLSAYSLGIRCGEVLHPLPSVTFRQARPQLPLTLSRVKARCRFALT